MELLLLLILFFPLVIMRFPEKFVGKWGREYEAIARHWLDENGFNFKVIEHRLLFKGPFLSSAHEDDHVLYVECWVDGEPDNSIDCWFKFEASTLSSEEGYQVKLGNKEYGPYPY